MLGATGPVGSRVVRLLALEGAKVKVASRTLARAEAVCQAVRAKVPGAQLTPVESLSAAHAGPLVEGRRS